MIDFEYLSKAGVSEWEQQLLDPLSNLVKMTQYIKDKPDELILSMIKIELQTRKREGILRRLVQSYNGRMSLQNRKNLQEWLTKNP